MCAELIKSVYQDPQLEEIRSAVSAFDDRIPFLLLPVRLETRFVQTDRSVEEANRLIVDAPALLERVDNLQVQLQKLAVQAFAADTKTEKQLLYRQLDAVLEQISVNASQLEISRYDTVECSPEQLKQLKTMFALIRETAAAIPAKIEGMKSNYQREQYLNRFGTWQQNRLNVLDAQFNTGSLPKLEFYAAMHKVEASVIASSLKEIIKQLQEQSVPEGPNLQEELLKTQAFQALLQETEKLSTVLIAGTSAEIDLLQRDWETLTSLLSQWTKLVESVITEAQPLPADIEGEWQILVKRWTGLQAVISYPQRMFSNRDLTHSVLALQEIEAALHKVKEIYGSLAANRFFVAWQEGLSQLNALTLSVQGLCNCPVILPSVYKQRLLNILTELDTGVLKTQAPSPESGASLDNIYSRLAGLIRSLETDTLGNGELRFLVKTITVDELWVRIFPDDIAVHTHETELTPAELEAGKNYWKEFWLTGGNQDLELGAWRQLCVTAGPHRAAWAANKLTPKQLSSSQSIISNPVLLQGTAQKIQAIAEVLGETKEWSLEKDGAKLSEQLSNVLLQVQALKNGSKALVEHVQNCWIKTDHVLQKLMQAQDCQQEYSGILEELRTKAGNVREKVLALQALEVKELADSVFPLEFPLPAEKKAAWTQPPKSPVMPDRFAIITVQGGKFIHIAVGSSIEDPLIMGLNPKTLDSDFKYDRNGNLQVHPEIQWLTDFKAAVASGMGVIIPITPEQKARGFDQVLALGIKNSDALEAKQKLEALLENHHYKPRGMAFIPGGTPTNNTEKGTSGFATKLDPELTFAIERQDNLFTADERDINKISDGKRLADSLGISPDVLQHIQNSGSPEMSHGLTINRVLSPATLGYFMEEILNIFQLSTRRLAKEHFDRYVVGQGWLPPLRVGNQPYGILVSSAFSQFRYKDETMPEITEEDYTNRQILSYKRKVQFDLVVRNLLHVLAEEWKRLLRDVKHAGNTDPDNPQAHFMNMLGLEAHSMENVLRCSINCAGRQPEPADTKQPGINFSSGQNFSPENFFGADHSLLQVSEKAWQAFRQHLRVSRLNRTRFLDSHEELKGPRVTAFLSEKDPLPEENFIQWLMVNDPISIWNKEGSGEMPSHSLLFLLLRHAWLLTYREVALNILHAEGLIDEATRAKAASPRGYATFSPHLNTPAYITLWNYLFDNLEALDGLYENQFNPANSFYQQMASRSMAGYLADPEHIAPAHLAYLAPIEQMRADCQALLSIPTAQLDRLLSQHLDICSYRLDAWSLSLANRRLVEQRARKPQGIYLGSFGWVENLRPAEAKPLAAEIPSSLLSSQAEPVFQDPGNEGFIHAPSLNHAVAGAMLRSGYVANRNNNDLNNPFAVNLSSERVRAALKLMDGVRQGVDVGILLGYQFERGLHERYEDNLELDQYIYPFRRRFPGTASVDSEVSQGQDERQVVNGLSLLKAVRQFLDEKDALKSEDTLFEILVNNNNLYPFGLDGLLPSLTGTKALQAIYKEIDRLADVFDALGDLMLAESVYQVAQGNHARAALATEALAEGKNPPEPEIVHTPRGGNVVTQRVILNLKPLDGRELLPSSGVTPDILSQNRSQAKPPFWEADLTPRALAEPSLNYWVGERLGNPDLIRCFVEYSGLNGTGTLAVSLADLQLQPLDVLLAMGVASGESASELNRRIAHYTRKKLQLGLDAALTIFTQERSDNLLKHNGEVLIPEIKTFYEIAPLVKALADVTLGSRPASAEDVCLPGEGNNPNTKRQDADELQARLSYLKETLKDTAYDWLRLWFDSFPDSVPEIDYRSLDITTISPENFRFSAEDVAANLTVLQDQADDFRDFLWKVSSLGVPYIVPESVLEKDERSIGALVLAGSAAFKTLIERLKQAEPLLQQGTVAAGIDAAKALLGEKFVIIPHYLLRNPSDIANMLAQKDRWLKQAAEHNGLFPMDRWLQSTAKVRKRVAGLEMVKTLLEIFGQPNLQLIPGQLPSSKGDYWVGEAYPDTYQPPRNILSLVFTDSLDLIGRQCSLLVDEWFETIPNKEEMTGITFNYNQPGATAPQTLLLAVTPEETGQWRWDNLVYTLLDTLEMAKLRGVEPDQLDKSMFSQFLPMIIGESLPDGLTTPQYPWGKQVVPAYEMNNK